MATARQDDRRANARQAFGLEIAELLPEQGNWTEADYLWLIVNPQTETITVLRLEGAKYAEHGVFKRSDAATSALLADFTVSVDAMLDAD